MEKPSTLPPRDKEADDAIIAAAEARKALAEAASRAGTPLTHGDIFNAPDPTKGPLAKQLN